MKRFAAVLLVILSSCAALPNSYSFDDALETGIQKIGRDLPEGSKIAILDFKSDNENLSRYVIEELYDKLINRAKLSVMERNHTDTIAREVGYQLSGEVDDNEIINIGHQLGADYVVTGQIVFSGEAYRLRVFAIDIEKARRIASSSLNINPNDRQVNYLLRAGNSTNSNAGQVPAEKKPSIGSISVAAGNLELSTLSAGLLVFDFLSEEVNLPANGTIPVKNIPPGRYSIQIEYNDFTLEDINFEITPDSTTKINLTYKSGPAPNFPPVSKIRPQNVTDFSPGGWPVKVINSRKSFPEDLLIGIGTSEDRSTAEKYAYVDISWQLIAMISEREYNDGSGTLLYYSTIAQTSQISETASRCKIENVLYDAKKKAYWVLVTLDKKNAGDLLGK